MKSIRAKIMLLLFLSVLISSLIIGAISTVLTSSIIKNGSTDNMNLLCKNHADNINIILAKIEDSINTLSHYAQEELSDIELLKDDTFRTNYSSAIKKSALHHIESTEGSAAVWLYFDVDLIGKTDGFYYIKNNHTNQFETHTLDDIKSCNLNDTNHQWWHLPVQSGSATWIESYYNENNKEHIITYAIPLYKDSRLIGVIGADISIVYIENIVKKISIYSSGQAAVLKRDGTVVYHPIFKRGHMLGEGDPGFNGVVEALAKEEQTDKLIAYKLDDVNKRIASCKLRNGMIMVCFAPVSEIYKAQHTLMIFTTVIAVLIMFIALIIAFFVSREIARPIKKLNEAAKRLTDGEFDFDINAKSKDEIGELTTTFIETRNILRRQFDLLDEEAHRDGLTGVGNKSAFMDLEIDINNKILKGNANFSVAVFDVNKLKITNDVFGHMAGDVLLSTVSAHLSDCFNQSDVYRVGGDEFIVVFENMQLSDCEALIKNCIDSMKKINIIGYPECTVSCAYGVAHFNASVDHKLSDVVLRADKEMYKNKTITKKETFPWQNGFKGIKQIQVEKYCQLLETLTGSTDDYLFLMNIETGVIRFFGDDNSSFEIADGRELSNGIADMLNFVHNNDHLLIKESVLSIINRDMDSFDINFRMYSNNACDIRWVNCRGSVIKDDTNSHFVLIGRISNNAVKHLYNPITSLYNKLKLKDDLNKETSNQFNCLMLLDIDNLSDINLKYGSAYGDNLLKELAEELENRFSLWQIYHAEKDRFVVLLNVASSNEAVDVFEQIKGAMAPKCSISASVVPNEKALYISADNIYDYAVQILNNSKKQNIGQIVFFSKDCIFEKVSAVELLSELEQSVKNKFEGFSLCYQPQVNANDFSVVSAEALLRFNSKTNGMVYPERFIPILEETGLINEVGLWVISESLKTCKKWREYAPNFKISVNISPKQLKKKKFAAQIIRLLSKYGLSGDALIVEITESAQLDQNEDVYAVLAKLKQAGVQIAVDDFGTGYSNLSNLKQIGANIIKVDRVFVHDIKENGYNYNLIKNIIEFAKSNSFKVCLEGVETADEFVVLSSLQPEVFQGYLFDKPCAYNEFESKYFDFNSDEYKKYLTQIKGLKKLKIHAPIVNMEMKTILSAINVGLWIVRINFKTGKGELYSDETMRKLLGVDNNITPKECFAHWYKNVDEKHIEQIQKMMEQMIQSNRVVQKEYLWHNSSNDVIAVRCSGRCTEKNEDVVVFEGFHRIISDL